MGSIIEHQGIVENINGSHLSVKIVQTSACSSCSAKGHCSSSESKEKLIDITDSSGTYQIGDQVMILGQTSMGMMAVLLAFVFPFLVLILSLFIFMAVMNDDLYASLISLAMLMPYYFILWINKAQLKQHFSFTIKPINN